MSCPTLSESKRDSLVEMTTGGAKVRLYLTTPDCDNPLFDAFFKSASEAGYPLTDDVNGYQQEGIWQV